MSIGKVLSLKDNNKLVIPYPGKMFKSSIAPNDKALCFVINKGYLEISDLNTMLNIQDEFAKLDGVIFVGKTEKIRLKATKTIVYRQRLFFKSLRSVLGICKVLGLRFELGDDFHITVNNVLNCIEDLKYLERYSLKFKEPIDVWLTNCCIIHLHVLLKNMKMHSNLGTRVTKILNNKVGYLDRAPFLVSSYNIDTKSSAIFLELDTTDKRLYSKDIKEKLFIEYGYTDCNIKEDIRKGVFK